MSVETVNEARPRTRTRNAVEIGMRRVPGTDIAARGEPALWMLGGALALGILMILGFLLLVVWNGALAFWPQPIEMVRLTNDDIIAGEPRRSESFRPTQGAITDLPAASRAQIEASGGLAERTLYRTGNYDLYGEDFVWIPAYQRAEVSRPVDMVLIERLEWGPFIGRVQSLILDGIERPVAELPLGELERLHRQARERWSRILEIEREEIGAINRSIEEARLELRAVGLKSGFASQAYHDAGARFETETAPLQEEYNAFAADAGRIRQEDARVQIVLADVKGTTKILPLSAIVRMYAPNDLGFLGKLYVYLSRWWEFLSAEPREANTEGGVWPAIFGTAAMTLLLVVVVAPFGIVTALYLREYARQGRLVSMVRISVNNLAGVPSIVYGVFGLGFFAYLLGGTVDQLFYAERLPNPTFGTGGLLWASLTLALLTVPVVIVATEEALAAVPRSMREGALACGASKWQTIRTIVLPRALPGILTGIILAMARGAGEVAPLMLVGVVKLAPELPLDGVFPFIHLERSFMHLGFHIYDVGFQSRNSEAGKPMVFMTTLLLIALIFAMNVTAIIIRNRLKRRFAGSQF
ncbi:MAG TPA: phosphate ABC transporter permease PstA [Alphaproteobacteria bacterium]|nr:phosphate ABC transporter permease PstA [Alphaproteobacteria bacterium]